MRARRPAGSSKICPVLNCISAAVTGCVSRLFLSALAVCLAATTSFLPAVCFGGGLSVLRAMESLKTGDDRVPVARPNDASILLAWSSVCRDESLYLSKAPSYVEKELFDLAREGSSLAIRYRAAVVLARRDSDLAIKVVADWTTSPRSIERLGGWMVLFYVTDVARVYKHMPPEIILTRYKAEMDSEVREQIERFFLERKASFAVDELCRTILNPSYRGTMAVSALARIGDENAVGPLIQSKCCNPALRAIALGDIGGRQAVDYLLDHVQYCRVPLALAATGDRRALPALRRQFALHQQVQERLAQGTIDESAQVDSGIVEHKLIETRIAILVLSSPNPSDALMDLAGCPASPLRLRLAALRELHGLDTSAVTDRVLQLYLTEMHTEIGVACVGLLQDEDREDVTEAFILHLRALRNSTPPWNEVESNAPSAASHGFMKWQLIEILHGRIGNRLFELFPSR